MKQFLTYTRHIWISHRSFILFSIFFTGLLQYVIIQLVGSVETQSILNAVIKNLPPQMRMMLQEEFLVQVTVKGAAAFGLKHPLVLAFLIILAIRIPSRHIAGEIETGMIELLLSYPVKRSELLFYLWISGALVLLLVIAGACCGSLLSLKTYHELEPEFLKKIIKMGLNLWLLMLVILSYTLLLSSFGKEGNKVASQAALITLFFFLAYFLSPIWEAIQFSEPYNIFTYYQPQKLIIGKYDYGLSVGVLLGLTIVCLLAGLWQFTRRDIP